MKRLWLILLSLGLTMTFCISAYAVDVKVSGEFYVAGLYLDKINLTQDVKPDPSTAFFYQRLRVGTDFIVSPSLKLVTRFDAMERVWGGDRSISSMGPLSTVSAKDSYETAAENQNIAIDWVYIDYVSPIGTFDVGIMNDGATGTVFGNSYAPAARIKYSYTFAPFTINAAYTKVKDQSYSAYISTPFADGVTDADNDKYGIEGVYKWKDGKAGININYYRYAEKRPDPVPTAAHNYKKAYFLFTPYATAKIGPVDIQAELNYATGKVKEYDNPSLGTDQKMENWSGWIDATANFAPVYLGGTFAYVSGDDPNTPQQEGGTIDGGRDWNPCLILFNYYDRTNWVGALAGNGTSTNSGPMTNALFYQGRVGVKPVTDLDIMASVSYANADKKPAGFVGGSYGWEVDVTGTYKITNNLSYMLGIGYLFTGDYFKGTAGASKVGDDYMVINKLTLSF
ncbi:MAG: hypothetical protein NTW65_09120 [Deltaproteobacteria bacterium]|nr:hypothetical protein [Deltaproteobacteria bacterium]